MPAGKRCGPIVGDPWPCPASSSPPTGTVSGNVIVNTIAGVPAATFQSINKRLASPVAPGTLTVSVQLPGTLSWHKDPESQ